MRLRKWWWAWPLLALLAGTITGTILPPPPLPKRTPRPERWDLPANSAGQPAAQALPAAVKFSDDAVNAGPQGPWRLAGIASGPIALVQLSKDQQFLRLRPGQAMPDGGTLLAITDSEISVGYGECVKTFQFYSQEAIRQAGENCPTPAEKAPSKNAGATAGTQQAQ